MSSPKESNTESSSDTSLNQNGKRTNESDLLPEPTQPEKKRRFETSYAEEAEWSLPQDMVEYFHKQMNNFIKPSDLEESITSDCPPPKNLEKVKVLDESFKELLNETGKKVVVEQDEILMNIQKRVWDVLGPFCSLWMNMEEDKDKVIKDDEVPEDIKMGAEVASTTFEQTVTLIGQLVNHILYQRRFMILSAMFNDKKKAKQLLKDWKDLLMDTESYLFGEKFEDKVIKTQKTKLKTKQLLKDSMAPKNPRFPKGPPPQRPRGRGRGSWSFKSFRPVNPANYSNNQDGFSNRGGRGKNIKFSSVSKNLNRESKPCSPSFERAFWGFSKTCHSTSGKAEVLSKNLGKGDERSNYSRASSGLQDSFYSLEGSDSEDSSSSIENEQGRRGDYRSGGSELVEKRGHRRSCFDSRSSLEHFIYSQKEGPRVSSCNKSQVSQFSHPLLSFQDGGFASTERSVVSRRLPNQIRSKGCLLLSTTGRAVQKICQIRVERQALSVPLHVFRSWSSSQVVYKTDEGPHNYFEKVEYTVDCLPRRYLSNGKLNGRNSHGKGLFDISPSDTWLHNKCPKISSGTMPGVGVSGCVSEFGEDGVDFTVRKSRENYRSVQTDSVSGKSECDGAYQTFGEADFIGSSSVISPTALQENSKKPDRGLIKGFLPIRDSFARRGENGIRVVDGKPETFKWEVSARKTPRLSHVDGCIEKRLGSRLSRPTNRGTLVVERGRSSYQHSGVEGSSVGNQNIYKTTLKGTVYPSSNGQHNSSILHRKDGGYPERNFARTKSKDLELSSIQEDHNYCGILTRKVEQDSRLGVEECQGLQRVETQSRGFQTDHSDFGVSRSRSLCISSVASTSIVRVVETRPILSQGGCFSDVLGRPSKVCVSSLLSDRPGAKQGSTRTSRDNSNNSSLARTSMVSKTPTNVYPKTATDSNFHKFVDKSTRGVSPSDTRRDSKFSGLADFRQTLETEGISSKAANLISNARRSSSISHYESAWGKWSSWARQQEVDPISCSIGSILDFLAELFEKGLKYNTICTYRSAISAYHKPFEGKPIGQNSRISALITGIFNLRPPLPRYTFVWDVSDVLDFIRKLPTDDSISNKDLTLKLASLLAITSASRASEVCFLDIRFLSRGKKSYEFEFSKLTKSWRRGKPRPKLSFCFFPEEPSLCVCKTIDQYLERSKAWRSKEDSQLLLSHVNPHDPVAVGTVSKWLMQVLELSGIDTNTFTGHSTRYASTSKAKVVGIPLQEIVKRGQWSSDLMFRNRYCRDIREDSQSGYDRVLLKRALNKEG